MFFGVGVSCRVLYSFVGYLYVSCIGSITSELLSLLSFTCYYQVCGFCSGKFPLPMGAWDGLHYFIVALSEPSI